VRARGELVRQRVAATNQLTATLDAFWPGAKAVFPDVEREIALAFLERYPTPESAIHLGEQRMAAFLTDTATAVGPQPPSSSPACAPRQPAWPVALRPPPAATPCSPSWACCGR
jgi:hypothetical protein